MANGLVINGAVQPMGFGLGSVAALRANAVPSQYVGAVMRSGSGDSARAMLCQGEMVPRVGRSDMVPALTCGSPGGMPCAWGTPQSALAGLGSLGDVSNWSCSDWAAIMTQMQGLLAKAESKGVMTIEYHTARNYFDDNTGVFQKPIFTCASATVAAQRIYNDLNRVVGGGVSVPDILNNNTGNNEALVSAVKWGAVALIAVAGAYSLGPIFRGIGGLIPSRKR